MKKELKAKLESIILKFEEELESGSLSLDERGVVVDDITKLIKSLDESEKKDFEEGKFDESEKNRIIVEVLKLGGVVGASLLSIVAYNHFQSRVLKFEETGRLTSYASKELHLPKFGKF